MPIDPRSLRPSKISNRIQGDRACRQCGFNLVGLEFGMKCPECGVKVERGSARKGALGDTLIDAPIEYLTQLRNATMILAGVAIGLPVLIPTAAVVGMAGFTGFARAMALLAPLMLLAWLYGVWKATAPRPPHIHTGVSREREWSTLRQVTRAMQATAVAGMFLDAFIPMSGAFWIFVGTLLYAVLIFSVIPLGLYLALLAEWANDTDLAARFRMIPYGLGVIISINLLAALFAWLQFPGRAILGGLGFLAFIFGLILVVLWLMALVSLANTARWAIINKAEVDARDERRRQRVERKQAMPKPPSPQQQDPDHVDHRRPVALDPEDLKPLDPIPLVGDEEDDDELRS